MLGLSSITLPAPSCVWTPASPAGYSLVVYAKTTGSTVAYEKYNIRGFVVSPPPLTGLTVDMSPRPVQTAGQPVDLSATALGGKEVGFRFKVGMKSGSTYVWELLRDYTAVPTCTWTPLVPGAYLVDVAALDTGSAASAYVRVPYRVLASPPPTLTGFTPASGPVGTVVTLTGTHFTGASAVMFTGTAAAFTVVNTTTLTATVPAGATTGPLSVTTPGGPATSATAFTVTGFTPPNGHEMVWVPGGLFTRGTPYDNWWGAAVTQQVMLSGFWLDKYEVTVAQYRAFCAATERALPSFSTGYYSWSGKTGWDDPTLQNHPIVNVTWYDAQAYADWTGLQLPTEAQWEYAARGPQGYTYPWGGSATASDPFNGWTQTKCVNTYNSYAVGTSTWPVGSFPEGASWCGAQDLAGNVYEWCMDWYGPYSNTPVTNPTGASSGTYRVLRGGSWYDIENRCRGTFRSNSFPIYEWIIGGFRCVFPSPGP